MKTPRGWDEVVDFTGWRPEFLRDLEQWERTMVLVPPPMGRSFFFDGNQDGIADPHELSRGIRLHPRVADDFAEIMRQCSDAGYWSFVASTAGGYNFRAQRGSKKLSCHALGLAVDFDARRNPFKKIASQTAFGTEPGLGVVRIFESHGWVWGGDWPRPDAMHFQACAGY